MTQGSVSAGLLEPGTDTLSDLVIVSVSDIFFCFGLESQCQAVFLIFESDVEGEPPPHDPFVPFQGSLVEDGTLQDLSGLLGTIVEVEPGVFLPGLIVRVQSDVEGVPELPRSLCSVSA